MPENKNTPNYDRDMNKTDKDFGRQGQGQNENLPGQKQGQGQDVHQPKREDIGTEQESERKIGSDRSSDVDVRR